MNRTLAILISLTLSVLAACGESESVLNVEQTIQAAVAETVAAGTDSDSIPEPSPTSTATPVATETPIPTSTAPPEVTPTSSPTPIPTPSPTPAPTSTVVPTATVFATPIPSMGEWVFSHETNPLDDSVTTMALLRADKGSGIYGDPIYLVLRCQSGELDAYVSWESFLGLDDVIVTHRIGSHESIQSYWGLSTNNQTTFYPGTVQHFISQLAADDSFVAQVTPYAESPITAIFRLNGVEVVAKEILAACGTSVSPVVSGRYVDPDLGWSIESPGSTFASKDSGTNAIRTTLVNESRQIEGTVIAGRLIDDADVDATCAREINRQLDFNIRALDEQEFLFGDYTGKVSYYPYTQVGACVFDGTNIAILLLQGIDLLEVDEIIKSFRFANSALQPSSTPIALPTPVPTVTSTPVPTVTSTPDLGDSDALTEQEILDNMPPWATSWFYNERGDLIYVAGEELSVGLSRTQAIPTVLEMQGSATCDDYYADRWMVICEFPDRPHLRLYFGPDGLTHWEQGEPINELSVGLTEDQAMDVLSEMWGSVSCSRGGISSSWVCTNGDQTQTTTLRFDSYGKLVSW